MSGGNFDGTSFDSSIGGFDVDSTADTHDGFDDVEVRRRVKQDEKVFKSARQRLRDVIERAWDGPQPEPVAAQVREIAAPYVERLESGALRINYADLERRHAAVMAQVLAFEGALRAEYEARMLDADDDDVMLLTWD